MVIFEYECMNTSTDILQFTCYRVGPLHFYTTGVHILPYSLAEDAREETEVAEGEDLGAVLAEVLTKRFRYILDASFNSDSSEAPSMTDKLDFLERRLYEQVGRRLQDFNGYLMLFYDYSQGQKSQQQLQRWFRRKTDEIHAADMVRRHRKRKADTVS